MNYSDYLSASALFRHYFGNFGALGEHSGITWVLLRHYLASLRQYSHGSTDGSTARGTDVINDSGTNRGTDEGTDEGTDRVTD